MESREKWIHELWREHCIYNCIKVTPAYLKYINIIISNISKLVIECNFAQAYTKLSSY